jgi:hypothetical protein
MAPLNGQPKPIQVFVSYSHKDERLLSKLEEHLAILKRSGAIDIWHDRRITAGDEWAKKIADNLESSQIILLLITPAFISSDYCYGTEMSRALEKHESGEARVIPIILKSVDWTTAPFGKLQALPKDAKPVASWRSADEAWANVAEGIRKVVIEPLGVTVSISPSKEDGHQIWKTITDVPFQVSVPYVASFKSAEGDEAEDEVFMARFRKRFTGL